MGMQFNEKGTGHDSLSLRLVRGTPGSAFSPEPDYGLGTTTMVFPPVPVLPVLPLAPVAPV
jgi:hypothetical protein